VLYSEVIIIGGGPAGSSCAWELRQKGIDCLILDKQPFPRMKSCAGWITPQVMTDLKINKNEYPYGLTKFDHFHVHLYKKELILKVDQYAVRRFEFDPWLLQRCGAPLELHEAQEIKKDGEHYVIDDRYSCKYLVGAGGTHCPVYRTFFQSEIPRDRESLIVTMEEEFQYICQDTACHLWFMQNRLPGYSWYVMKRKGYVNIGIGGLAEKLKQKNDTIKNLWQLFIVELDKRSLIKNHVYQPIGYSYFIRDRVDKVQMDHVFLTGDAAGLATRDMGEGIGPAVRSGILAARAIVSGNLYVIKTVKKFSFPRYRTGFYLLYRYVLAGS
jgi:flavin-dependent dehydrogenase